MNQHTSFDWQQQQMKLYDHPFYQTLYRLRWLRRHVKYLIDSDVVTHWFRWFSDREFYRRNRIRHFDATSLSRNAGDRAFLVAYHKTEYEDNWSVCHYFPQIRIVSAEYPLVYFNFWLPLNGDSFHQIHPVFQLTTGPLLPLPFVYSMLFRRTTREEGPLRNTISVKRLPCKSLWSKSIYTTQRLSGEQRASVLELFC